jgi:3',5'-nucleoside bisphosphate phosphatase
MTLVFAKERSIASIREAMLERRTVAWFNGNLAGSEEWLGKLFDKSLTSLKIQSAKGKTTYRVINPTDFTFRLNGLSKEWTDQVEIPRRSEILITVPEQLTSVRVEVTNWHTGIADNLVRELKLDQ